MSFSPSTRSKYSFSIRMSMHFWASAQKEEAVKKCICHHSGDRHPHHGPHLGAPGGSQVPPWACRPVAGTVSLCGAAQCPSHGQRVGVWDTLVPLGTTCRLPRGPRKESPLASISNHPSQRSGMAVTGSPRTAADVNTGQRELRFRSAVVSSVAGGSLGLRGAGRRLPLQWCRGPSVCMGRKSASGALTSLHSCPGVCGSFTIKSVFSCRSYCP